MHLAGACFGFLYYRTGWCLASLIPGKWSFKGLSRRLRGTNLRVHREEEPDDAHAEPVSQQRVDEILAKISREGEGSLTSQERRDLEEASRRYRGHRKPGVSRGKPVGQALPCLTYADSPLCRDRVT